MWHASLGRARFLNGEPIADVRAEFSQAADYIIKDFRMAYDPSEPEYAGESVDWSDVEETTAIDGMDWALMSGDFAKAVEMAHWWRDRQKGENKHEVVNRYTHALKHAILGNNDQSVKMLEASMLYYAKHPPKGHNFKNNYYTFSVALLGIVTKDEEKFNEGLALQLKFYEGEALGENYNVTAGYIADDAVALANLGLRDGLKVKVSHMLLPPGLLV
jgi:hypothetical protein